MHDYTANMTTIYKIMQIYTAHIYISVCLKNKEYRKEFYSANESNV